MKSRICLQVALKIGFLSQLHPALAPLSQWSYGMIRLDQVLPGWQISYLCLRVVVLYLVFCLNVCMTKQSLHFMYDVVMIIMISHVMLFSISGQWIYAHNVLFLCLRVIVSK